MATNKPTPSNEDNPQNLAQVKQEQNEAARRTAEDRNTNQKADPVDRNEGRGVKGYDEKNPNPNDIHSDDPLVAGLANGQRQVEGTDVGTVK